jgi:hypothetical protein
VPSKAAATVASASCSYAAHDVAGLDAGAAAGDDRVRERGRDDRLLARRVDGALDRPGVRAVELSGGRPRQLQVGGAARSGRREAGEGEDARGEDAVRQRRERRRSASTA